MPKTYTTDYFIKKFKAIPARLWTTQKFVDGKKRCALGHCGVRRDQFDYPVYTPQGNALESLFYNAPSSAKSPHLRLTVTDVNDGGQPGFTQPTPKSRILAALQYIKDSCQKKK